MGRAYEVRLPVVLYKQYSDETDADNPFYGFEYDFTGPRAKLAEEFGVPSLFDSDLLETDDRTRGFYANNRHLIMGGKRTGTNLHFDPKATCAWNQLLFGRKKWVFFPPCKDREFLEKIGSRTCSSGTARAGSALRWWMDRGQQLDGGSMGMLEVIQEAGDLVFIPPGWWHAVVNLEFCVAVTKNHLIPATLAKAWPQLVNDWPMFTRYLQLKAPGVIEPIIAATGLASQESEEACVEWMSECVNARQ